MLDSRKRRADWPQGNWLSQSDIVIEHRSIGGDLLSVVAKPLLQQDLGN